MVVIFFVFFFLVTWFDCLFSFCAVHLFLFLSLSLVYVHSIHFKIDNVYGISCVNYFRCFRWFFFSLSLSLHLWTSSCYSLFEVVFVHSNGYWPLSYFFTMFFFFWCSLYPCLLCFWLSIYSDSLSFISMRLYIYSKLVYIPYARKHRVMRLFISLVFVVAFFFFILSLVFSSSCLHWVYNLHYKHAACFRFLSLFFFKVFYGINENYDLTNVAYIVRTIFQCKLFGAKGQQSKKVTSNCTLFAKW